MGFADIECTTDTNGWNGTVPVGPGDLDCGAFAVVDDGHLGSLDQVPQELIAVRVGRGDYRPDRGKIVPQGPDLVTLRCGQ
ncbi:hypothetical protein ACWGLF_30880 [Streptomyces puniciscabiei]